MTALAAQLAAAGFGGEIVTPGDARYNELRKFWNAMVDRRPALIARCSDAGDVPAALGIAREAGRRDGTACGVTLVGDKRYAAERNQSTNTKENSMRSRIRITAMTTLATFLTIVGPSWAGASTTPL